MTKPQLHYFSVLITGFFVFFSAPIFGQATACIGDTIAPFFERCPQNMVINQSVNAGTAQNCAFVQWDTPLAYDNCGVASMNRTWSSGECFPIGVTTVTYTAIDSSQNSATCTFTVTVLEPTVQSCTNDSISPILSRCPENIVLNTTDTCAIAQWVEPIATDNCSTPSVFGTFQSGMCFPLGYTTVIYTATDSMRNQATCSFVVTVNNPCATDTIKPVFSTCPNNIVITTAGTTCASAQWTVPRATDNCGTVSTFATAQPGRCFSIGVTTVTYRATDLKGNVGICAFTVNVSSPCAVDTIRPTISACPTNIVLSTYDTCAVATWVAPTATDNCSVAAIFPTYQSGTCFPLGRTIVSYLARDAKNNTSGCEFTVTVNHLCAGDSIKPTFTSCPRNIVLTTIDSCAFAQWAIPTITDNCGTPTLTSTHSPGNCFNIGQTNVTYWATDTRFNKASCSFVVTVTNNSPCAGDITPPVITRCPANITLTTSTTCATARWSAPRITDNCGTPTLTSTHTSGACLPVGETTVVYTGKDTKNNRATCSFKIRVTSTNPCATDTVKPVFANCPANIVLTSIDSCAIAQWIKPTATDNCGTPSVVSTHNVGFCFPIGITTVGYSATDAKSNRTYCSFTVTVGQGTALCAGDIIKPVLTRCPTNISLVSIDSCTLATWTAPTATDNCGTPTISSTKAPNSCFGFGTTTVTFTAKDANNNTASCSFTVTVTKPCANDTVKPRFPFCPTNIVLTSFDSCARATWVMPVATDNCSEASVTGTHNPNFCFKTGVTNVVYTAKDANNNTGLCSFTVTVTNPCATDITKPSIAKCPASIVLNTTDSCAIAQWVAPTVTDNCGTPTLVASHQAGRCFPVGTTQVTYTARDTRGNTTLCTFSVTVNNPCFRDSIKPVIKNCPANISLNSADSCSIARWIAPTATDNCGTPILTTSHQSGLCFRVGSTTVTYTAKDTKNNIATCTFKVTVSNPCFTDTIKPTIYNCPASITKTIADTAVLVTWKVPTALDNCGSATLSTTKLPNTLFGVGTTSVVYTASDSKNNRSTCTFKVTVNRTITACSNDTVKPVFTSCPVNISITTTAPNAIAQWTTPTATDNCSTPSVTGTFATGANFPTGTTAVVFTAKDAKGNLNYCRFSVTVITNRVSLVLDSTKCYALIARSSKKAMSIANASTVAGAYSVQWTYLNTLNQKWKIAPADSNSFNFTNKLSNLNLDTRWGSLANNERLTQWGKSATAATQKWQLTLLADGFYRVTNKGSGRALSVSGGTRAVTDGSLLIQSSYTGLTSQQWSISEVPCTSTTANFTTNDVLDMQANPEFNRARIEWSDNTGYKNDYYEIQKLNQTSGEFERLDVVNNKSLSNAPSYQTYYDNSPMDGDNSYRVKVVYLDSVSKFSPVKKLVFNGLETVKLFPNPANDYVDIDLAKFGNEAINIYLYNGFGKQVAFRSVQKDKFSVVHFDISQQEMGNYVMRITANGKKDVIRQLQIVR